MYSIMLFYILTVWVYLAPYINIKHTYMKLEWILILGNDTIDHFLNHKHSIYGSKTTSKESIIISLHYNTMWYMKCYEFAHKKLNIKAKTRHTEMSETLTAIIKTDCISKTGTCWSPYIYLFWVKTQQLEMKNMHIISNFCNNRLWKIFKKLKKKSSKNAPIKFQFFLIKVKKEKLHNWKGKKS